MISDQNITVNVSLEAHLDTIASPEWHRLTELLPHHIKLMMKVAVHGSGYGREDMVMKVGE